MCTILMSQLLSGQGEAKVSDPCDIDAGRITGYHSWRVYRTGPQSFRAVCCVDALATDADGRLGHPEATHAMDCSSNKFGMIKERFTVC